MAIFRREKDKEEAKKRVWGNVLAGRGMVPASADANYSLSQVQGTGRGRVTGKRLRSPGRGERLNRGRRQEFHGSWVCGEGRSKGMKREIERIPFDTRLGE